MAQPAATEPRPPARPRRLPGGAAARPSPGLSSAFFLGAVLLGAVLLGAALAGALAPAAAEPRHRHSRPAPRAAPPAPSPDPERARAEAARATEAAQAAAAEEQHLAAERVAAAARLRTVEEAAARQADQVAALAERERATAARLAARAAALAPLLPLMQRLALFPAETMLAVPAPPGQAVRGLLVLQGVAAGLEREAAGLRAEQTALARERASLAVAVPELLALQREQAAQAGRLDQALEAARARREQAVDRAAQAARRAAAEAARAETLRGAVAVLERTPVPPAAAAPPPPAPSAPAPSPLVSSPPGPSPMGRLSRFGPVPLPSPGGPDPATPTRPGRGVIPVAGTLISAWGAEDGAGPSNGIAYRPAPEARVVAPCAGRVRFAAPFRSYGGLVILECGGGYTFVLGGMARLDVTAGASVLAGEPVGGMPAWDAARPGPRPSLYVELRRDGQPVDPAAFLGQRR